MIKGFNDWGIRQAKSVVSRVWFATRERVIPEMDEGVVSHVWISSHLWSSRGMRWPRLGGSFKLYVSFAEYSLFYRALLRKRSIILRSLLIVATPQTLRDSKKKVRRISVVCRACARSSATNLSNPLIATTYLSNPLNTTSNLSNPLIATTYLSNPLIATTYLSNPLIATNTSQSYLRWDFSRVNESSHIYAWVMLHTWMSRVICMKDEQIPERLATVNPTGRRSLIGCLKMQIIFRKRATNRASCDSSSPCSVNSKSMQGGEDA